LTIRDLAPKLHPGWIYRAEYLQKPKHNTIAYDRVPKQHLIIFDICPGLEEYLSYEEKADEAERLGLECVPYYGGVCVTSMDELKELLKTQSILGGSTVEGLVFKNYRRFGRDGKALMGKFVSEEFKERNIKDFAERNPHGKDIIQMIGQSLRTEARWKKAIQHLAERGELLNEPRDIGALLKEINKDIRAEEADAIKEQLFGWAWKNLARMATAGFPEWYKELLAKRQFEGNQ